ncbi:MAG: cellulase family glycosylhydrolase [Calothrix sp. C42_A2020_038]|nr:cellulase family glycosylhydrolase [Calothrix sp. C42_A2020_038]
MKRRRIQFYQQLFIFSLVLVVFLSGFLAKLPIVNQNNVANAATLFELPLSTSGARIIDAKGKTVLLTGVNWFGMETETHSPHGLWLRDYKEMLSQIKSLGYNTIRLPYSVEALRSSNVSGIDYTIGSNKELEGKTPLEVMDCVVQEAERQGLMIVLDSHRLSDKRIPELWYGDGFSEADWIDTWRMLAQHYKNQTNIIGADLKNEPHGKASWGTNDLATDWRLAAERAGNAIMSINPNWLIIVEGVEQNVPGQKLKNHWQGGNLEGVRRYPVRLKRPNKIVYSPHEYGPGVYNMPYFSDQSFPNNMPYRWETGFYYIARQRIAPIWIGEFGGKQVDKISIEGIWQNKLVDFIRSHNLGFAYWSWNPNSSDTAGILLSDWQTIDAPKQVMLSRLLPVKYTPPTIPVVRETNEPKKQSLAVTGKAQLTNNSLSPQSSSSPPSLSSRLPSSVPSPSSSHSPSSLSLSSSSRQIQVTSKIDSDWQSGFCVSFKVGSLNNSKIQNWQLKFNMNQAAIYNSWNATFKQQGTNEYIVTPLDWGRVIEPNQVRDVGFCANKLGTDYQPHKVQVKTVKN